MIGTTKLTPANSTRTLRTTVPIALVRMLGLKEGSLLEWDMEIKDGKMVVLVRPTEPIEPAPQSDRMDMYES